jgi:hypothetical protein
MIGHETHQKPKRDGSKRRRAVKRGSISQAALMRCRDLSTNGSCHARKLMAPQSLDARWLGP